MSTALVVGPGGLAGAYTGGVMAELGRHLKHDDFSAVYASSVGVYMAGFFLADQPDVIELTWREYVCGNQLVGFRKPLYNREWLDLEYLANILSDTTMPTTLDRKAVAENSTDFFCTLTDYKHGNPVYVQPDAQAMLPCMTASCAVPYLHSPVNIFGKRFVDGAIADPLPIDKAFADGADEVVVVHNGLSLTNFSHVLCAGAAQFIPDPVGEQLKNHNAKLKKDKREMSNFANVTTISPPSSLPLWSFMDTNKKRLNQTIDMGIASARSALPKLQTIIQ